MSPGLARRVLSMLTLLGSTLLLIGLFLPWIIRIDYLPHAGRPNSPTCPPPTTDARSFWAVFLGTVDIRSSNWWLTLLIGPDVLFLLILLQGLIAVSALRNHGNRTLFAGGLILTLAALTVNLLAAWIDYCLFFCSPGFVAPGVFHIAPGLFGGVGVRWLAPGFWFLLGGFLLTIGGDLLLLMRFGRRT